MPVWSFRAIVLIAPIPLSLNVWTHSPPSHVEKSLVTHRRRHSGALATASSPSEESSGILPVVLPTNAMYCPSARRDLNKPRFIAPAAHCSRAGRGTLGLLRTGLLCCGSGRNRESHRSRGCSAGSTARSLHTHCSQPCCWWTRRPARAGASPATSTLNWPQYSSRCDPASSWATANSSWP